MSFTTTTTMSRYDSDHPGSPALRDQLDDTVTGPLAKFDAFPKLPSTYKTRSEGRGFLTLFVTFAAFLLVVNDLGEYIWGWPNYEFNVDKDMTNDMNVNVDLAVNMPCQYLSVDLRDAVGDRLYLSNGFRRDGTAFDVGLATTLKEHAEAISARQAVSQSRKSRGLFATVLRKSTPEYRPTYNYQPDGSACRVYGTIAVKKVTANLHITTLGHGYASSQHTDHKLMNLSHVITEFSFGPHFPDITQPLDNSLELTDQPFVAYQYFLHIVPTTYIAPRSSPLQTNQYSVTHYTRVLEHGRGVPGIFFKFDLDPMSLTIHQRTTSLVQLLIRCVGVVGGVFVCMGYAVKITTRAVEVVTGADRQQGIVAAEATGVGSNMRKKWGSGELRSRVVRSGSGWAVEGGSPYGSHANTPVSGTFSNPPSPYLGTHTPLGSASATPMHSPHMSTTAPPPSASPGYSPASSPGPSPHLTASSNPASPNPGSGHGQFAVYPPSPNLVGGGYSNGGFPRSPIPGSPGFATHPAPAPPAPPMMRREPSRLRHSSSPSGKKDD